VRIYLVYDKIYQRLVVNNSDIILGSTKGGTKHEIVQDVSLLSLGTG
jgi:hypothetical protein